MVAKLGLAAENPAAVDGKPAVDWAAVRADYEARELTLDVVCERHGISSPTLHKYKLLGGWTPRQRSLATDPRSILLRLKQEFVRHLTNLERTPVTEPGSNAELGKLVGTFDKLVDVGKRVATSEGQPIIPQRDIKELRHRLVLRIAQARAD